MGVFFLSYSTQGVPKGSELEPRFFFTSSVHKPGDMAEVLVRRVYRFFFFPVGSGRHCGVSKGGTMSFIFTDIILSLPGSAGGERGKVFW